MPLLNADLARLNDLPSARLKAPTNKGVMFALPATLPLIFDLEPEVSDAAVLKQPLYLSM
ncbi:hypothetical protein HMPREF0308_1488 [Corynebacterium striatum ATCC 6940]|nr:hypothetical protein HMPREF0308_1488 [Corynebacterium striatum ATCC 6940]